MDINPPLITPQRSTAEPREPPTLHFVTSSVRPSSDSYRAWSLSALPIKSCASREAEGSEESKESAVNTGQQDHPVSKATRVRRGPKDRRDLQAPKGTGAARDPRESLASPSRPLLLWTLLGPTWWMKATKCSSRATCREIPSPELRGQSSTPRFLPAVTWSSRAAVCWSERRGHVMKACTCARGGARWVPWRPRPTWPYKVSDVTSGKIRNICVRNLCCHYKADTADGKWTTSLRWPTRSFKLQPVTSIGIKSCIAGAATFYPFLQ